MTVAGAQDRTSVLSVENLSIALPEGGDRPFAVEQVSFAIKRNEVVCLVGNAVGVRDLREWFGIGG